MATNPRTKNPNDAALSAVEEALRLDYSPEEEAAEGNRGEPRRERRPEPPRGAAPDPQRQHRQVQPGGAGRDGDRVLRAKVAAELFFKFRHTRPLRNPAGTQRADHRLLFLRTDERPGDRNHFPDR
jgi:hypothetical protein